MSLSKHFGPAMKGLTIAMISASMIFGSVSDAGAHHSKKYHAAKCNKKSSGKSAVQVTICVTKKLHQLDHNYIPKNKRDKNQSLRKIMRQCGASKDSEKIINTLETACKVSGTCVGAGEVWEIIKNVKKYKKILKELENLKDVDLRPKTWSAWIWKKTQEFNRSVHNNQPLLNCER